MDINNDIEDIIYENSFLKNIKRRNNIKNLCLQKQMIKKIGTKIMVYVKSYNYIKLFIKLNDIKNGENKD